MEMKIKKGGPPMNKRATAEQKLHVAKEVKRLPKRPPKQIDPSINSTPAMPPKRTNANNQYR
jgi:hypothetical protein